MISSFLFPSFSTLQHPVRSIIQNGAFPECSKCQFYLPQTHLDYGSSSNRCARFGEKDLYSGKINYEFVSTCRSKKEKCGIEGKEYLLDPLVDWKRTVHWWRSNLAYFGLGGFVLGYIGLLIFMSHKTL